ncbi:hypothetical protein EI94DRAFT_1702449 [Lactarius quietus]|nr:hypothetical protein EI94DRAFT_1702449 [Lactarius quietus]
MSLLSCAGGMLNVGSFSLFYASSLDTLPLVSVISVLTPRTIDNPTVTSLKYKNPLTMTWVLPQGPASMVMKTETWNGGKHGASYCDDGDWATTPRDNNKNA